jgi:putative acetyltransferase
MNQAVRVRPETPADFARVREINASAFETTAEADLVDRLRALASPFVSLVAEAGGTVVGHILFTPVSLTDRPDLRMAGLAPMAVDERHRNAGVGSALVRAGLGECRRLGFAAAVVLGHPGYYPRFGFVPSANFGFASEYIVPAEVFMAVELVPGALKNASGIVRFHEAFRGV